MGTLPYCCPITTADGPAHGRARPHLGMYAEYKGSVILKTKYNHNIKRNFNRNCKLVIATSIASTFWIFGTVAANAGSGQSGIASVYSTREGHHTASGRRLNNGAMTAAHRSLPFGTKVRVTNHRNGRTAVVTITDRGPFVRGRVIDVTPAAAYALGISGLARVTLHIGG
jgi:rare lipoprotein A